MARPKSIDREVVLDLAEDIVCQHGISALTIDAVAKAAGISKGGVQSCFGTKATLIDALFARFGQAYERRFREVASSNGNPAEQVRAHVEATFGSDKMSSTKVAGLLAALLQSLQDLDSTLNWYRDRLQNWQLSEPDNQQALIAFLATEGAFMLRYFGLMEMDDALWQRAREQIRTLLDSSTPSNPKR
ncbi:TetR/AcrR family transcriptional regulator [Pseudomonas aeruginosa]|jgi:AcrR family transcriptional regulator|nr:TetR/AcrR family transcriptional regulator [Achromobacter xylosoxidans]ECF1840976.1 TetR/AcrR family transcriptional regulator [Salmonella enterica subsp. enterica serovar Tennessee]TEI21607.1 TetR/AcrR family transcriptional regulator [Pseudomonas aeruginosa]TEI23778.1 TetR/AcrR family transcriptional regulator [Pseudomonas aeruginosa]HBN8600973.1 TetR family transcriptional regulator [Pseudomonas aeruginosa]HCL3713519.1 TetR family transcriptional regulator [Pseudomonas aeruginosa]